MKARWIFVSAALGMLAVSLLACPQAVKTAVDGGNYAVCILNHSTETPAQIVDDCQKQGYNVDIDIVQAVLLAHRAAAERETSRARLLDGGRD
jgi:hypothetical protein